MKSSISSAEKELLESLIQVAGGMGRMASRALLNHQQEASLSELARKGYVTLTKKKFMVVLTYDD